MPHRSLRLQKKLHKLHIFDVSYYASLANKWRAPLLSPDPVASISIGQDSCEGLPDDVCLAIRRCKLRYSVKRAVGAELDAVDPFTKSGAAVVFKFWADDFPSIVAYTGNSAA